MRHCEAASQSPRTIYSGGLETLRSQYYNRMLNSPRHTRPQEQMPLGSHSSGRISLEESLYRLSLRWIIQALGIQVVGIQALAFSLAISCESSHELRLESNYQFKLQIHMHLERRSLPGTCPFDFSSPASFAFHMHAFMHSWSFLLRERIALGLMTHKLSLCLALKVYYLCLG